MASLTGWVVTGPGDDEKDFKLTDYEGGLDPHVQHDGHPSAYLRSIVPAPGKHAVVMQSIRSEHYRGRRVVFSAWVKTEAVAQRAGLWMRIVTRDRDHSLAYGNALVLGTTEWQRHEIVLNVAPESVSIMFGLSLQGTGAAWISGAAFDVVQQEPARPLNLLFED